MVENRRTHQSRHSGRVLRYVGKPTYELQDSPGGGFCVLKIFMKKGQKNNQNIKQEVEEIFDELNGDRTVPIKISSLLDEDDDIDESD